MSYKGDPISTCGLGISSLINNAIIRQPCTVLRRQCQVHPHASKMHLIPVTLLPIALNIVNKDGLLSLWKGSIGTGVLWAVSQVSEVLIADVFSLPRTLVFDGRRQRFWRHIVLKASTYLVTTPFIISSFVETVRSGARADDSRLLDVIFSGLERFKFDFIGGTMDNKRFSVFYLFIPTVGYYTIHFLVQKCTYAAVYGIAKRRISRKLPSDRTRFDTIMPEMISTMTSMLLADLVCYPMETVLHRLYIQGTRTLIDNLDTGLTAISIGTRYSGFFDCLLTIIDREGAWALFGGIGAVALQYGFQLLVHTIVRMMFDYLDNIGRASKPTRPPVIGDGSSHHLDPYNQLMRHSAFGESPSTSNNNNYSSATAAAESTQPSTSSDQNPSFNFPSFAQTQQHEQISGMEKILSHNLRQPATTSSGNKSKEQFGPFGKLLRPSSASSNDFDDLN